MIARGRWLRARLQQLSGAWLFAAALTAVGVGFGTLSDPAPARAESRRGGWRVLEADFHAHTRFSDGFLSPFDLVIQARRRGLDVLAVTEHNNVFPAKMARAYAATIAGAPTILIGEEVTTKQFHVHGIGLDEKVHPLQPLRAIIGDIHRQGGLAIAAHPVKSFWPSFLPVVAELDGAEVMHPIAYGGRGDPSWRWEQMRAFYLDARERRAPDRPLTAIGSSDYHFFSPLGLTRTLVFARSTSGVDVLDALRAGRTVVYDLDGGAYGDALLIELLAREPYTIRTQDYGYRGEGPLDRITRALGWLGLLGLFVVRRRRPTSNVTEPRAQETPR